jgi:hypothetical protein
MEAEKTGCFIDVVDHLKKQNHKLEVIREAMAAQEEQQGWAYIIDDMIEESEGIRDKVSMLHLRTIDN